MKIIEQSVELIDEINQDDVLKKLERCGRVCYQSEAKEDSAADFVRMLIKRRHESVLEHVSLTFRIVTTIGIMKQLTRHRIASFSVESTRFCKYDELTVIDPPADLDFAESLYNTLLAYDKPPEIAAEVLPPMYQVRTLHDCQSSRAPAHFET